MLKIIRIYFAYSSETKLFKGILRMSLIITRRIGETIIINDDKAVTILGVQGNQVRLGVVAPKNVSVDRAEIRKKIEIEKQRQARNNLSISSFINSIMK